MLQSPTITSSSQRDLYYGNPWSENDGDYSARGSEAEETAACTPEAHSMGGHKRFYTTGHPLCIPDDGDGDELTGEFTRRASSDSVESQRLRRRSSTGKGANGRVSSEGDSQMEEKEVIVHEVKPTDSLAGVALKYNVALATIRAANKLWANDSIHLRRVLYIPLEAVSSKQPQLPTSSFRPSPGTREMRNLSRLSALQKGVSGAGVDWEAIRDEGPRSPTTKFTLDAATIRRVPMSELSFFPPSSSCISASSAISSSSITSQETAVTPIISSLPRNPLATLFNGAKEEIIHRLSFDSTRESSETGEDEALELEEVRRGRRSRSRSFGSDGRPRWLSELLGPMNETSERTITPNIVRTVQLQPSPDMVIPRTSTRIRKT